MVAQVRPAPDSRSHSPLAEAPKRFDRVALSSVFGNPLDRRTWSGAPFNVGRCLQKLGVAVEGIHAGSSRGGRALLSLRYLLQGYGLPRTSEALLRMPEARRQAARHLAEIAHRRHIHHILHFGSLDLPPADLSDGVKHYLYCDHDWSLSLRHRTDMASYSPRALDAFERQEQAALTAAEHVFTFGAYVRDHIISHYGLAPDRVTAVGSGMGQIEAYEQPKGFTRPSLLFVAKHIFAAKGGHLLVEAFRLARIQRPDLTLTIVGDEGSRRHVPPHPGIHFHARLPWRELQRLYRMSTLLVQPMLNDPWGQVYLEALASRTPVIGLMRNGLPEILEHGRHGFLVEQAEPAALADTILQALSDPDRLARMAWSGQQHVLRSYSWDSVAQRMALI